MHVNLLISVYIVLIPIVDVIVLLEFGAWLVEGTVGDNVVVDDVEVNSILLVVSLFPETVPLIVVSVDNTVSLVAFDTFNARVLCDLSDLIDDVVVSAAVGCWLVVESELVLAAVIVVVIGAEKEFVTRSDWVIDFGIDDKTVLLSLSCIVGFTLPITWEVLIGFSLFVEESRSTRLWVDGCVKGLVIKAWVVRSWDIRGCDVRGCDVRGCDVRGCDADVVTEVWVGE